MAHNLNYNAIKREYSFYSRKEVPWHGLGQFVTEAKSAEEALIMAHLDYVVKSGDVYVNFTPKGTIAVPVSEGGVNFVDKNTNTIVGNSVKKGARVPNYKCVYRDDTKDVFDIVSDRYEIVQNFESLDIIFDIIRGPEVTDKSQIVIQTAGALNKGETVFVTAKMPSYMIKIDTKEDIIDKYIVFTTSHNKSAPLTAIVTDIRVVCNNTLRMALNSKDRVTLKHTKNVRENFNVFRELLGVSNKYSTEAKLVLETLSRSKVTDEQVRSFIYDLFVPEDKLDFIKDKNGKIELVSNDFISTRMKNRVMDVLSFVEIGAGQEVGKGSAYWLYNGVTSFIHNGMTYKDEEDRFKNLIGGSSEILLKKTYSSILNYV
jgi:phage/plasmid-like protein (TIGR03299 family)